MPIQMNNECIVQCKNCGEANIATWSDGRFGFNKGWKLTGTKGNCFQCHTPISLKGLKTVKCPHCGKIVEKTADNRCLGCKKTLQPAAVRGFVACPECGMQVSVPEGHAGAITCGICGTVIPSISVERELNKGQVETEQYIKLPDVARMTQEDYAIWKHPQSTFPFKSRMQVNEGTYALFLQNGMCKDACDPGSYLLENTDLDRSQKLDAAMQGENVVFRTDIYCVLQDIPEIKWGIPSITFRSAEGSASYAAHCSGRIALQVCDAKAYARYLGFRALSLSELTGESGAQGAKTSSFVQMVRDAVSDVLYSCANGMTAAELDRLVPAVVQDRMTMELNRDLAQYGLCVKGLRINVLDLEKTAASHAADHLREWVQSEFAWRVEDVRVHMPGNIDLSATTDFSGSCRLRISDENTFWNTSEVKGFLAQQNPQQRAIQDFFSKKVEGLLNSRLAITAQDQIDLGYISDVLDGNQYVLQLSDRLRNRLNDDMYQYGLAIGSFTVNLPSNFVKSAAMENNLAQPRKQQVIRHAAESPLQLLTDPVRIYTPGKKSIYIDYVFGGKCGLRVRDDSFYQLSEIQSLLTANQPISEKDVRDQLTARLNPLFNETLTIVAQSVVEQTNADIRELGRFTAILKNSVQANMIDRVNDWGLELESLHLDTPRNNGQSENLEKQMLLEQVQSGTELNREIQRLQNDQVIFGMDEKDRVAAHGMQVQDNGEQRAHEAELRRMERQQIIELEKLHKGADLEKLVDEIAEAKRVRSDEAILDEYKRKFRIREEQLNQRIREAQIEQQAQIDADRRAQQAQFASKLAEAENQRALNDIMRKIAETDLDWKQKLDEYDRLRRRTSALLDAEIRKIDSDTEIQILRDKNDAYYEIGRQKIRLNAEEAELLEQINRYTEDRKERQQAAEAARVERRAILDFEQRMQDRREHVAQQMELLKTQYDHELALREKDDELKKLTALLEHYNHEISQNADVRKAEAAAETQARIAEAQAAAKRMEEQLKREEDIAQRAEEFRKELLKIQAALELTRLGNDRNRDDRMGRVAVATATAAAATVQKQQSAQADADRRNTQRLSELEKKSQQRFNDLDKKMDAIIESVKSLRKTVKDLTKMVPAQPTSGQTPGPIRPQGGMASGTCPVCRQMIDPSWRVCAHCGHQLV